MSPSDLKLLQQRMATAVMRPLTRDEQMRKRDASCPSVADEAAAFIRPNDRLTSFERLEIYNRQYWFRLFSSFEEDFPGLKSVIGSRRFQTLMRAYLEAHPSRSFTLRNLGSSLISWLRQNPQYTHPNTDSAIAMAALEWAHIEAFDNESRQPLSQDEIANLNADSHIALQPYLRLLTAPYAVDDALLEVRDSAHDSGSQASNAVGIHLVRRTRSRRLLSKQIYLAIHRHEDTVYYKRLSREDWLLLEALERGDTLGEAIEAAFRDSDTQESDRPDIIQSAFHHWMQMGWLCAPRTPAEAL
ncbi:MAG TPA: DNA-binding domain-containing protein [Edaphobacter sp.]